MTSSEIIELKSLQITIIQLSDVMGGLMEVVKSLQASQKMDKFDSLPEWLTLKQAVELKGGASLNTYKNRYSLQPLGGRAEAYIGSIKVWNKKTVIDWLKIVETKESKASVSGKKNLQAFTSVA